MRSKAAAARARKKYYYKNRTKILAHQKEYCKTSRAFKKYQAEYRRTHRELLREKARVRHRQKRDECLLAYGHVCSCRCGCKEDHRALLSLDHVRGGGASKTGGTAGHLVRWAKRHGWPKSLRLLCHNCNHGRYLNGGTCPRTKRRKRK